MDTNTIILIGMGVGFAVVVALNIILLVKLSNRSPQTKSLELPKLDFKTQLALEIAEKARKINEIKTGVKGLEKDYKALIKEKDELEEQRKSLL